MNIIKHGKPKVTIKRFRCEECGCTFEADKCEYKCDSQYKETYFYCQCPECGGGAYEIAAPQTAERT